MDLETLNQYWALILVIVVWELIWKGMALWKAARAGDNVWYVIMLVINSVGILPIAYILLNKAKPVKNS